MTKLSLQHYPVDLQHPDHQDFKRMRLRELSQAIKLLREQVCAVEQKIAHCEPVSPLTFSDTQFLTADKKRKILKQWGSFVKSGFSEHGFTHNIYEHLHLHCSYIAHYDKSGFYVEYWGAHARDLHRHAKDGDFTLRPIPLAFYNWKSFMSQFSIWGEYRDINTSMMFTLKAELEALVKDLLGEVNEHFEADNTHAFQLFLSEKQAMREHIESLRKEASELETKLSSFSENAVRTSLACTYSGFFGEDFASATDISSSVQLSLI